MYVDCVMLTCSARVCVCVCPCVLVSGHLDSAAKEYLLVWIILDKVIALTRITVKDTTALMYLDKLQKILEGKCFQECLKEYYLGRCEQNPNQSQQMAALP